MASLVPEYCTITKSHSLTVIGMGKFLAAKGIEIRTGVTCKCKGKWPSAGYSGGDNEAQGNVFHALCKKGIKSDGSTDEYSKRNKETLEKAGIWAAIAKAGIDKQSPPPKATHPNNNNNLRLPTHHH